MQASNLLSLLMSVLWLVPEILACVGGLVACVAFMPRCPKAATWGLLGFTLMLFCILGGAASQIWIVSMARSGRSLANTGMLLSVFGVLRAVGIAVALALLTLAIFADRQPRDSRESGK